MIDFSKHTVLIVDDEIEILKSLNRGLHSEPYEKIFVSSGAEALEVFARKDAISVIITDMRMPGMNGLDLLKSIDEFNPKVVKIVLTGYTQLPQILATINNVDIFKFLTKPWDLEAELKVFIREAIEFYENSTTEANLLVSSEKKGELYNKMLSDSYEKGDYVLRLYDELIKSINQHHMFSIQSLKSVESKDDIPRVIQQMNDRIYYLNKIFEMSRYTLKSFNALELKESLEKSMDKIGIELKKLVMNEFDNEVIFYDNFKMIMSILSDLVEIMQFNGPGISNILMKFEHLDNKEVLHFIVISPLNDKLKVALEEHDKFVAAIIKILNGRFIVSEIGNDIRLEIFLAIKRKSTESVI